MARYLMQRIFTMFLVALVVVTATFFLMRALPGGPFSSERNVPQAILRNLERKYNLHKPIHEQYLDYVKGVLVWDLGPSFKHKGLTVNDVINRGFPISARLGAISLLISIAIGIPLGILAALRHNTPGDRTISGLAILTAAAPSFVIAGLLQYYLAYTLKLFPAATWGGGHWRYLVLPVITLSSYTLAWIVKLTRSSMLEVVNQDYIRTARAKGLPQLVVVYRHMIKNALVPVVASLGPMTASVLTGSFIVESIFNIPGIGREFVQSITNRDYTVTIGLTVFFSLLLAAFTLICDIALAIIDPRVRLEKEG
nr:MAG: peptide ABC transporter permease [Bacillota bacterium]